MAKQDNSVKNFPNLRFPGFEGEEWEVKKLGEIANIYDGTHQTPKYTKEGVKFVSVENINDIENTNKFITPEAFQKEYKIKPQKGDVLMTRITAGIIGATAIVKNNEPLGYYVSLALIRTKVDVDTNFLAQRIETNQFKNQLHKRIIHVAFPKKINLGDIQDCVTYFPSLVEQEKISSLMSLINDRILLSMKIISHLETLMKGFREKIFIQKIRFKEFNDEWKIKKLGAITKITTGKLDANAMVENGEYRFYTCAKEYYQIDKYAFDTEALLISGNGANVGYIHYYKGKFNAYQRTYVLDKFQENIIYIKFFLDSFLQTRIYSEKKEGNTPYIVLSTLSEMEIKIPSFEEQTKIANFLSSIDEKIETEKKILAQYEIQKKYLLANLFI